MSDYNKAEKSAARGVIHSSVVSPFFDGWIIMLALGGLAHQLHRPHLALAYWSCVLIQIIAIAVLPSTFGVSAYLRELVRALEVKR